MGLIEYDSQKQIDDFIKQHSVKKIGCGHEGVCYLTRHGKIVKQLFEEKPLSYFTKFFDVSIDGVVFAETGIAVGDYVSALILDYVKGTDLYDYDIGSVEFTKLISAMQRLLLTISQLTENGIMINDFFLGNIIFDGDSFYLIDVQNYEYSTHGNLDNINLRTVIGSIYHQLFFDGGVVHHFVKQTPYSNCDQDVNLLSKPDEVINGVVQSFNSKYNTDVKSVAEMRLVLSRVLKN